MLPHNAEVSRRRGNDEPSNIDLIFTDEALQVSDIVYQPPLGKSDHDVITILIVISIILNQKRDMLITKQIIVPRDDT